ncbi:MAG: Gfo/Idh/MocA family oxidoreductase [Phycisphaerae bacterium]|nr:Gfo/Idh/MocA family oxidoreductase [Phycisphaerae bacterium]
MLRIGIAGLGFMGRMHWASWQRIPDARVVAVCDSNPKLRQELGKAVGNIQGAGPGIDLHQVQVYSDFASMVDQGGLDGVSITLPTHLHTEASVRALQAGLHVLCEKPMALTLDGCDQMVAAAAEGGKVLQIGHCIRFWPEYAAVAEIVRSGRYGAVKAALLRRLAAVPTWGADAWLTDPERSGGMALDLHIHDTDYLLHILGRPWAVYSRGATLGPRHGLAHITTSYLYAGDQVVTAEGSWAMAPSFGFQMALTMALEGASLVYDSRQTPTLTVYPEHGEPFAPALVQGDGYLLEIGHFAGRIRGEIGASVTTPRDSRQSVEVVLAEIESVRAGEPVLL